jgi:hypothetical protein
MGKLSARKRKIKEPKEKRLDPTSITDGQKKIRRIEIWVTAT